MQVSSCKHSIRRLTTVLLCCHLLFTSFRPPDIQQQLKELKDRNDLTAWIYLQIQWVARSPVSRSGYLRQAIQEAWRPPSTNEEIQAWQDLLANEGYALLVSGDIVQSTDAYTSAFQWARQHVDVADASIVLENILKPLGNNYTRLGDYEQALFIHRKALAIARALDDPAALAGTLSNLANAAGNMGRPSESLDYCRQGLSLANRSSPLRGLLLSEQADALMALDQPEAARNSIRQSIAILEKNRTPEAGYWLLIAYQQAGDMDTAQPALSLKYYQKALQLEQHLSVRQSFLPQRQRAKLFQHIGSLYAHHHQPGPAFQWFDKCLSILTPGRSLDSLREKDLYAENTLMDLLFASAGLAHDQGLTDKAIRLYKFSFITEYALRQQLITGSSREQSVSDNHERYEAAIRTAWDAWKATGNTAYRQAILDFMEDSKARLLLDEVLQQQQLAVAADSVGARIGLLEKALIYYRKEARLQPDSLRQAMAKQEHQVEWDLSQLRKKVIGHNPEELSQYKAPALQNDQLIRSFFSGTHALYIVEYGSNGIQFTDRLNMPEGWQDSIRTFTHHWFEKGAGNMINRPAVYYQQAYSVYSRLFDAHPLTPKKKYILLPDGALSLLPMDALVTAPVCPPSPASWPFLIRQASISYAWSIRTLEMQSPANSKGLSGFFLTDARQLPLLTNITEEQDGMARIIKNGKWYTDDKATTTAFRQALQTSAVVHISSHAFSGKDTSQTPHIQLYDQPFYLFELKDLQQHPGLVVLSACRTGDGRMVTGEGVQSLARAFIAQGANAVVAGWWNVNDAAAARLMQHFYQAWTRGGQSDIADALHRSKLDWLDDPQVPYQHKLPYYWAALNYAGNPAPLPKNFMDDPHHWPSAWTLGIAAAVLAIVLLIIVRRFRR